MRAQTDDPSGADRRRRPCRPPARQRSRPRRHFRFSLIERQPPATIEAARSDGRTLALLAGSVAVVRGSAPGRPSLPWARPIERVEVIDVGGGGQVHYDSDHARQGPVRRMASSMSICAAAFYAAFLDHAGPDALSAGEVAALERGDGAAVVRLASGTVAHRGPGRRCRTAADRGYASWPASRSTVGPTTSRR